jgi:hypothetical protein
MHQFGDRGGPNDPGLRSALPSRLPEHAAGGWKIQYPLSVRLKGTMAIGSFNLMPRSGLEPTVRIDICESAAFTKFATKAIYAMRNNNWIRIA